MKQDKDRSPSDRRNFLKLAGLSTVGTIATAASSVSAAADVAAPADNDKHRGQYRETEHVKRAYDLARF